MDQNMDGEDVFEYIDFETDEYTESLLSTPKTTNNIDLKVGVEFSTVEDVQNAYEQYAKGMGFQVRRRNSRPRVLQLVCHREGFPRSKTRKFIEVDTTDEEGREPKSGKIGCRASLHCSLDSTLNLWRITKFIDSHNHEMVTPRSRKFLRTHKFVSQTAKCLSQVFESERIPVGKVINVLNLNPDEATFTKKDCYNYMTKMRQSILDSGDAQAVYKFCLRHKELDPNFRYSVEVDDEGRLLNFFWIDARSKSAYDIFGDVVSFDTTYKTNKYNMPFAPFVGIDNHMHTIMFGCALLQNETEETFVWLFNEWLKAVDGKVPTSFVTDQDLAIMNAVKRVFPTTRHRLCIWHIKKKFPERLSHIYSDKSNFKVQLNSIIHESLSIEYFEREWNKLSVEYNLTKNEWWIYLYNMRSKWVPIFCEDVFFGGLSTTGRSESINSFFDDFVRSGTTLKEFVNNYGQALENRYETFRRAEFDSRHKVPILTLGMELEEHGASVYTSEVFKIFRGELKASLSFHRQTLVDGHPIRTYQLSSRLNKNAMVKVVYNLETHESVCECRTFEFKGILCKHILSVLFMHSIDRIPTQYILDRWTKDVGRKLWESPIVIDKPKLTSPRMLEIKSLFDNLYKMSEDNEDVYDLVKCRISSLHSDAQNVIDGVEKDIVGSSIGPQSNKSSGEQTFIIQDPNVVQTKGRKKLSITRPGRIRSGIEIANDPKVRCSVCFTYGHNKRTCPKWRELGGSRAQ